MTKEGDDEAAAVLAGAYSKGESSGQKLKQYATRHQLSVAALYNAKSVFKRAGLLPARSNDRRRDKLKILAWDHSGFIVWYKRLEEEKFAWPHRSSETVVSLSAEQLRWLLDGYDVFRMKPHQALHFSHAN